MLEQSNISGNTYIQFSFEKSLRKYQKPPHKKIKNDQCTNNKHNAACEHCISKLHRRSSVPSTDRKGNLQNNRKVYQFLSRQKGRQYSYSKYRRQIQNSNQNLKLTSNSRKPLSECSLQQDNNLNHLKSNQVSNFNEEAASCKKVLFSGPYNNQNFMENQLSIQKNLLKIVSEEKNSQVNGINTFEKIQQEIKDEESRTLTEQQDYSFRQIQILKTGQNKSNDKLKSMNMLDNQFQCIKSNQNLQMISYAYFSSCSSLQSNSALQNEQKIKQLSDYEDKGPTIESEDQNTNDKKHQCYEQIETLAVDLLTLQSRQEIKKQSRKQFRQRVFYKIKKLKQLQFSYSQCQHISQNLIKQLVENHSSSVHEQPEFQCQNEVIPTQMSQLEQQSQSQPKYSINSQIVINQNFQQNKGQEVEYHVKEDVLEQNTEYKQKCKQIYSLSSKKRKGQRINFEIQKNYKSLGRIKIIGLDNSNQSICLSIRRFTHLGKNPESNQKQNNSIHIDRQQVIKYLISQRPNLQKHRSQLFNLLSDFINQNSQP